VITPACDFSGMPHAAWSVWHAVVPVALRKIGGAVRDLGPVEVLRGSLMSEARCGTAAHDDCSAPPLIVWVASSGAVEFVVPMTWWKQLQPRNSPMSTLVQVESRLSAAEL
jgi:hypothetical protein